MVIEGSVRDETDGILKTLSPNEEKVIRLRFGIGCEREHRLGRKLIENGMEAEKRKQREFFDLAGRFRSATDPEEVERLGDQMGRMVFGE